MIWSDFRRHRRSRLNRASETQFVRVMKPPIKVVAVDDDALVRRSLEVSLKGLQGVRLAGCFGSADKALDSLVGSAPDVLLWDLFMPGSYSLECLRDLHLRRPEIRIVLMSPFSLATRTPLSRRLGVVGSILKPLTDERIAEAVRQANGKSPRETKLPARTLECEAGTEDPTAFLGGLARELLFGRADLPRDLSGREEIARAVRYNTGELGRLCGMSGSTLHRGFMTRFSTAPCAWLKHRQMDESVRLLRAGVPMPDVVAQTGFDHRSNFCRAFRDWFGRPPAHFGENAFCEESDDPPLPGRSRQEGVALRC